jgi:prophage antirepressor-like protein
MIPQQNQERQLFPLTFQQHTVRTVLIDGVPWFVAKDVCDVLGLENPTKALLNFPDDERNTLTNTEGIIFGPGNPNVNIVNEPGLYRLIFQSRKPEAEQFKTWVFTAVLPQIRQTGFFFPDPAKLDEQQLTLTITRYFASKRPNKETNMKIGECLVHFKNLKRHGEFLPCLTEMGVSHRNAVRYMQIFRNHEQQVLINEQGFFILPARKPSTRFCLQSFPERKFPLFHFNSKFVSITANSKGGME